MKKFIKVLFCIVTPVIAACAMLSGCKKCGKDVTIEIGEIMQDKDLQPTQAAMYEEYSKAALAEYFAVADRHKDEDGEVEILNEEVVAAARSTAARLFAFACYNERHLDKFVYFSDQHGYTDVGSNGSADSTKQEYYLRVNEHEGSCGYRYFYTIKKANSVDGPIKMFKSAFESARLRVTDQTDLLYRFEGDEIRVGARNDNVDCDVLDCDWKTGKDWGEPELQVKKREFISPEDIEEDIQRWAGVDIPGQDCGTIHANINILADNIIKFASVDRDEYDGCINVMMAIDTEVANADSASLKMLRQGNGSDNCKWRATPAEEGEEAVGIAEDTGLRIIFRLWDNGLFRQFYVDELWRGKVQIYTGNVKSETMVFYSYSDRDCDMTANLAMLERAKAAKG